MNLDEEDILEFIIASLNYSSQQGKRNVLLWDPDLKYTYTRDITVHTNPLNRCQKELQPNATEITKSTYDKAEKFKIDNRLWGPVQDEMLVNLIANSKADNKSNKNEVFNDKKNSNISVNKNTKIDNSKFSKKCEGGLFSSGYKKGTDEFNDCVKKEVKTLNLKAKTLNLT